MSDVKNVMYAVLEKRVSKKSGNIYHCINVYVKKQDGSLLLVTKGSLKPLFIDDDKLEILNMHGITPLDVKE